MSRNRLCLELPNAPIAINGFQGDAVFPVFRCFSTISKQLAQNLPREKLSFACGHEYWVVFPLIRIYGTNPFSIKFPMRIFEESVDDLKNYFPLCACVENDIPFHEVILGNDFWMECEAEVNFGYNEITSNPNLFGALPYGQMNVFVKDHTNSDYSLDPDDRVILLFDIDCFEIQVHQEPWMEGHPRVVVNSQDRITSVSYEAKDLGINREETPYLFQARKIYPDVIPILIPSRPSVAGLPPRPDTSIAREATETIKAAILNVLSEFPDRFATFQFSSNDEFYVDVTEFVNIIQDIPAVFDMFERKCDLWPFTFLYNDRISGIPNKEYAVQRLAELHRKGLPNVTELELQEFRLIHGSQIAKIIINEILAETGYKSSVGIGSKKLISKIASDLHRPGSVTILAPSGFENFANIVKIAKIPGLGGKTGQAIINDLRIFKMGELKMMRASHLANVAIDPHTSRLLGFKKAQEILNWANGLDDTPVIHQTCFANASVNWALGKFFLVSDIVEILLHLLIELTEKLEFEAKYNFRTPTKIKLNIDLINGENINALFELKQRTSVFPRDIFLKWFPQGLRWNTSFKVKGIFITANF